MVGRTLGHYEIEVYRALDTTLKRDVAIKVLPRICLPMWSDSPD